MSAIQPFEWDGLRVRVVTDSQGEPWFVARDVCAALGFAHVGSALRPLADDEKGVRTEHTPGGDQQLTTVSEAGLYRLIFGSRIAAAEPFRRWVTHDVLPQIRRTGAYSLPADQPRDLTRLEILSMAMEAEQARLEAEAKAAALAPAAQAWDALASAAGDYSLRDAAQILCRDHGIAIGQNRLSARLRDLGWTDTHGVPYQRHVDNGRLRSRARSFRHPRTGAEVLGAPQVRITPHGVQTLQQLLAPGALLALDVAGARA